MTADQPQPTTPAALSAQLHDLDEMQYPELVTAQHRLTSRRGYGTVPSRLRRTAHRLLVAVRRTLRRGRARGGTSPSA